MQTTIGKLLVNEALPSDHQTDATLGKDEADALLAAIATKHPDNYRAVSHALMNLGANAVYTEGATLRSSDSATPFDRTPYFEVVDEQRKKIMGDRHLTPAEKKEAVAAVYMTVQKELSDRTFKEALAKGNPFALQVQSKARGNKSQLTALMTTPSLYEDAHGSLIPVFIRRSYAEGLRPHEYFAATYGARKSVISTKFATRDAGDLGKQFGTVASTLVVTKDDCGTHSGMPVKADDYDNIGAVLARDAGKFKAGTVLTRSTLAELKAKNVENVVLRSPITCSAAKGLCKRCVGLRENGKFPELGDNIGVNASSALAERIAQSSLNVKHSGGVAKGKGAEQVFRGFPVVENLAQVPHTFPNRAALAEETGKVEAVEPAPQGGMNVTINGVQHYVGPDLNILVKPGDSVEAGDQLSAGIINPREVVDVKGIGEGRRYFAERMTKAFRDNDYEVNRRNMEVMARAMIDHVVADDIDGAGDALPGEIQSYNHMAHAYKPRADAKLTAAKQSVGKYLEQPALHYTIGTKLSKNMVEQLGSYGVDTVLAHDRPVAFTPQMLSLRAIPQHEPDWMAQLGSSHLRTGLLKHVHQGATSAPHGLNPIPALAKGVDFGDVPGGIGY